MQKIGELISEDITERILKKLNEIEKSSNLSNLDVSTILNKIHVLASKEFVTNQNELWKDVSKLSVDFYLDFEYYKQFTFQSKFSCAEYHDALKNLGFKEINGFLKSYCQPSKTLVINYVVQSCIYRTIMMKMNGIDSVDEVMTINNTSELIGSCPFCDKNLNSVHNCEACGATAEEIENLRNQAKLIENKHNQLGNDEESVGGGIEDVKKDFLCTEHVDPVNITGNSLINPDNNNDNTNENSKSIPNINFSEEIINKQKINRGTQCGGDREKNGRTESCICCDGKCEERNDGNELYCTYCGLCLENSCKEISCNNPCSEEPRVTNESYSNNEELSDDHNQIVKSKSDLENERKDKSCNNPCSEELRVTNKSDSNNLHDEALGYNHDNLREQKSDLENERKEKSCNISCSEKSKVTKKLYSKYPSKEARSENLRSNDYKGKSKSSIKNERKEKSCNISCSEKSKVTNKLYSKNSHNEEPTGNKWKCKRCGFVNEDGNEFCAVCMENCGKENVNKTIKYCSKCKQKEIICDDLCEDCLKARDETWICWYRLCEERNDGNELYCKKCGLDKSANRERGATVEMNKYGKIEQVWICYACDNINYDLNKSICDKCLESKFDSKDGSNNNKDKLVDDYVVIPSDNVVIQSDNVVIQSDNMVIQSDNVVIQSDNDKWKCKTCQSVNDRESLSCKQCKSPRIEMWSCKHCTMRNQISDNYCAACGEENVNKTIKSCSKCKQKEIICDDLCEDCLKARDEIWTCWYRLCENRNAGNVKYCQNCGLDRYADKINFGAPMWRCKGDVRDQIWICYICYILNDISSFRCKDRSCFGSKNYKYTKRCHKCKYKYNYEYSNYCEMCKNKFY